MGLPPDSQAKSRCERGLTMFNSGIGIFEIALIAGVALMLLGPEKFPGFAKVSVRTFRDIKKYMAEAQREIATELNPMKKELESFKKVDVEGYIDKLVADVEKSDSTGEATDEDFDDDGEYNVEPDASVVDDWYPEDQNEIMPGSDETAEMDEDSAQEYTGDSVPYGDAKDSGDEDATSGEADSESSEAERDDDFDMAGGFEGREEVVDAENPERREG